jgi:hypothetical protein
MSNTEQTLEQDHVDFKSKLEMFYAETQLSFSAGGKVLDVSPGSLKEWYRPRGGRMRKPASHIMRSVELKIDRLNSLNKEVGVYNHMHGLSPNDRVAFLRDHLQNLAG